MKKSTRKIVLFAGLAVTGIGLSASAHADDLVFTSQPSQFGVMDRANLDSTGNATNLIQTFTLPTASEISSLSYFGLASGVDLYITDEVGAGASDLTSVMWETHGYSAGGGRAWHNFNTAGLVLGAGTYYVVMASDDLSGGRWSRVDRSDAINLLARGNTTYGKVGSQRVADLEYTFHEGEFDAGYALRIDGTAVPAPGTLAIAATGGVMCLRRRRR